jgi:hypothetical protein
MRKTTVDPSKKAVTAQGGCRWSDVDTALAQYHLATVGGTVNDTGIGGLTLGGGYGHLMGQYGFVIDNLLEVDLVLADGSMKKCSESENEELFWASRGAGANFGVATSFTYQAYEQKNEVYAGLLFFQPAQLKEVFHAANLIHEKSDGRSLALPGLACPPPTFTISLIVVVFFNGLQEEAETFFQPLLSLHPLINTATSIPYSNVNSILNELLGPGFRRSFKGSSTLAPFEIPFAEDILGDFEDLINRVPDARQASLVLFEFFPSQKIIQVSHPFSLAREPFLYIIHLQTILWRTVVNILLLVLDPANCNCLCKPRKTHRFTLRARLDRSQKRHGM